MISKNKKEQKLFWTSFVFSMLFLLGVCAFIWVHGSMDAYNTDIQIPFFDIRLQDENTLQLLLMGEETQIDITPITQGTTYLLSHAQLLPPKVRFFGQICAVGKMGFEMMQRQYYEYRYEKENSNFV